MFGTEKLFSNSSKLSPETLTGPLGVWESLKVLEAISVPSTPPLSTNICHVRVPPLYTAGGAGVCRVQNRMSVRIVSDARVKMPCPVPVVSSGQTGKQAA